jgi:hypothetical protein
MDGDKYGDTESQAHGKPLHDSIARCMQTTSSIASNAKSFPISFSFLYTNVNDSIWFAMATSESQSFPHAVMVSSEAVGHNYQEHWCYLTKAFTSALVCLTQYLGLSITFARDVMYT